MFFKNKELNDFNNNPSYQDFIIENINSFAAILNNQGNFILWNKKAAEISGFSEKDLLQKDQKFFISLFPNKKHQQFIKEKIIKIISAKREEERIEAFIKNKNNKISTLQWIFKPLVDDQEKINGCIILGNDISERKKLEEQLKQAQKMETLGILVGGIAHDFNNILGGIMGTLSLMKFTLEGEEEIEKEEFRSYLEMMEEAGGRATNMIKRLLSFSKKQKLDFEAVDLKVIIQNVLRICENSFDKSIQITTDLGDKPAIIKADHVQMEQVILNFCINAAHSMTIMRGEEESWGGEINISIRPFDGKENFQKNNSEEKEMNFWVVSVKDSGVGIDRSLTNKIFDPFFTTKKEGEGSGLGLTMVANIIKQHGGFINLSSEIGQGTMFKIYLPRVDQVLAPEEIHEEKKDYKGKGLILIVDDEEMIRKTVKTILERSGYEVILAEDGEKGVELFKKYNRNIKIVLLDMVMPKMSGEEAFLQMKEINPELKVLIVSGFKQDDRVDKIMNLGVKGFIQKPFTLEELAAPIDKIIKH